MKPRARTLLPAAGLIALAVVAAQALRPSPPLPLSLAEAPASDRLTAPELDLGQAVLAGVVVDDLGLPVSGATLVTERAGRPIWTESDERGRFELRELDPGPVQLSIVHDDFGALERIALAGGGPVELGLGARLVPPPTVALTPRAPLAGRVLLRTAGNLEGFELAFLPVAPADRVGSGIPRRIGLDATGEFRLEALHEGEYEVALLPPWARGGTWPDLLRGWEAPAVRWTHVAATPEGEPRTLELVCVAGEIAGRVLSPDGERALGGAMITAVPALDEGASPAPARILPPVRSDAQGQFRIPMLPPGPYTVTLIAGSDRRQAEVRVPEAGSVDPGL